MHITWGQILWAVVLFPYVPAGIALAVAYKFFQRPRVKRVLKLLIRTELQKKWVAERIARKRSQQEDIVLGDMPRTAFVENQFRSPDRSDMH